MVLVLAEEGQPDKAIGEIVPFQGCNGSIFRIVHFTGTFSVLNLVKHLLQGEEVAPILAGLRKGKRRTAFLEMSLLTLAASSSGVGAIDGSPGTCYARRM